MNECRYLGSARQETFLEQTVILWNLEQMAAAQRADAGRSFVLESVRMDQSSSD